MLRYTGRKADIGVAIWATGFTGLNIVRIAITLRKGNFKNMKRTFDLTDECGWEAKVIVDEEKAAPYIKEMVEFWYGWERKLTDNKGDYTLAFIKNFGRKLQQLAGEGDWNICAKLNSEKEEGWYKVDGTYGITLVNCEQEYPYPDVVVDEITN